MNTAVIIPTVDRPVLLKRAIESVLNQDKPFSQIIIVNDGPTTLTVPTDPRITVVKTSIYEGLPAARKTGISNILPNIDAICYLDDDDILLQNHNGLLSKTLESGAQFAFAKALFKYPDGSTTTDPEPENTTGVKRYYDPNALMQQNIAPPAAWMHTVFAYNKIGGWDKTLIRMEDWDFWARLFICFGPPAYVDVITSVISKQTPGNLTGANPYSYSMACSWRDIVSDRIKAMAAESRFLITPEDYQRFHIPKVGVVMPVYNSEKYLKQAIESILSQTYTDLELICINNGSTDSSRKIIEEFVWKDHRVRLFDMPGGNAGVTKALNYGLLVSRSEYIARMDADDISVNTRFEKQVKFLDQNRDIMIVGSFFRSWNQDLSKVIWENNDIPITPEEIKKRLLFACCIGHPTVMMRRRIVEIAGGYDEREEYKAVEDYEFWLRVSQTHKMANIPEYLLEYRSNGISQTLSSIQQANASRLREHYKEKK